jgi:hypothetical protein
MPDFGIFRGFNEKLFGDKLVAGQLPINLGLIGSQDIRAKDPDYQAVLDYATTQGYTLPSALQQLLQNQLVVDLKDGGIWSKLDTFGVFATDGDSDFALIDWKRLSQYTAVNSPTFTTNQGFTGDGISAYIDTNFNFTLNGINYTVNDASRYFYLLNAVGANPLDGLDGNIRNRMILGSSTIQRINSGTNSLNSAFTFTLTSEFKSIHRTSFANIELFNAKTKESRIANSAAGGANQHILRSSILFSAHTVSCYAMGASLVSENDDFVDAFDSYLTLI